MSDPLHQPELDFEASDEELQLRLRWASNEAAFRRECERRNSPEMLTLRWIHGWRMTIDSDLRWWNALPAYQRKNFIDFFEDTRRQYERDPLPLYAKLPDFWPSWNLYWADIDRQAREEDRYVEEWADAIREAYKHHRPCPFDISTADPSIRWRLEYRLDRAIRRAGVPKECLHTTDENDSPKSRGRKGRNVGH